MFHERLFTRNSFISIFTNAAIGRVANEVLIFAHTSMHAMIAVVTLGTYFVALRSHPAWWTTAFTIHWSASAIIEASATMSTIYTIITFVARECAVRSMPSWIA